MTNNMQTFIYNASPARVVFGRGTVKSLPEELSRQKLTAPILLSTPRQGAQIERLKAILNGNIAGTFSEATMHTPTHVTNHAVKFIESVRADSIVSIGGGSAIGLGKAVSIRTGLPHICIPTTYSGSEMTPILGETADGRKVTRSDPKILPGTVMYDVDFTMTLSPAISATSGVNAIAHAVEALYAENTNPVMNLLALEGIKALTGSLPTIVNDPEDIAARSAAQYGAWLCGLCLGSVGMALHHKLCHTIGGTFNMPHAETHTILLPHTLAYNAPHVPEVMQQLATVFPGSNGNALHGLNLLLIQLRVNRGLKDLGFLEGDIDKAADLAISNPYYNPRPIEKAPIRELLRRAYAGEEARADL